MTGSEHTFHVSRFTFHADLLVIAALLLGAGLRLCYAFQAEPFVDEPTTLLVAQAIARTGVPRLPSGLFYGNDLPYSYLAGGLLALVGGEAAGSLLAVRLLSVAAAVLTMGLVYAAGRRLFSPWAGLWAAALLALAPESILWGGRARAYALLSLLALGAVLALYRGLVTGRSAPRRLGLVLFVVSTFVHPEAALLLPACLVGALALEPWRRWLQPVRVAELALAAMGVAARYGLQLTLARGSIGGFETVAGSRPPVQWAGDLPLRLAEVLPFFAGDGRWPWTVLALLALAVAAWHAARREATAARRATLFFSACLWLVPLQMVLFLGSTYQSPRYLTLLLPMFALLAARGLGQVLSLAAGTRLAERARLPRASDLLAGVLTALLVAALLPAALEAAGSREKGFRAALASVAAGWQPGDRLATVAPAASQLYLGRCDYFALGLEYEEFVYRDDDGQLVDRWLGAPVLRTVAELDAALKQDGRLWFVADEGRFRRRFEPAFAQAVWDRLALVDRAGDVLVFRAADAVPPAAGRAVDAVFGQQVVLAGYDLGGPANRPSDPGGGQVLARPGEVLPLTLRWQAVQPLASGYHVFVHLVAADGRRHAPADGPPLAGLQPMDHWLVGETLPDRRSIPLPGDLAPGRYRLEVGLYEPRSGDRLPVEADPGRVVADALLLDALWVPGPGEALPGPSHLLPASFAGDGDEIRLLGYDLAPAVASPGGSLELVLFWRAVEPPGTAYTVFVHLLAGDDQIRGQGDGLPQAGFYPTLLWDAGEVVPDRHLVAVEASAPAGTYRLAVGLYDPATGRRLRTAGDDRLILAEVRVQP